jgi:hypothetical protein
MEGSLDSLSDYMYIIVALGVAFIMFLFITGKGGLFDPKDAMEIYGDSIEVSARIAKEVESCWKIHRSGLEQTSAICSQLKISSKEAVTELSVTRQLDCRLIPNIECPPHNCSFCVSETFEDQDRLKWKVENNRALIEISYSGSERAVKVREILE